MPETKTFTLPQWKGRTFRVRSVAPRWQDDVLKRLAVVEVEHDGRWLDFSTIDAFEVSMVEHALGVFLMRGDYLNDCPFCTTHNAILATCERTPDNGFVHECRDCHRKFTAQHEARTYTLVTP